MARPRQDRRLDSQSCASNNYFFPTWLSISIGSQVRPQGQPAVQAFFLSRQPDNPPATAQGKRKGKREGGREGGRQGNELDSQPQIRD